MEDLISRESTCSEPIFKFQRIIRNIPGLTLIFCLTITHLFPAAVMALGADLIENGDIEADPIQFWEPYGASISITTEDMHKGLQALQISNRTKKHHGTLQDITDRISLDSLYMGGAWIKLSSPSDQVKMTIKYYLANGSREYQRVAVINNPVANQWYHISGGFTASWSGTLDRAVVYFEVDDDQNNGIYSNYLIDDINLELTPQEPIGDKSIVPTFESLGLYWSPTDGSNENTAKVRYRQQHETEWQDGLDLWFDERNAEYRGSLVHLTPDTTYEIELKLDQSGTTKLLTGTTWSEDFPIGEVIELPALSDQTLRITESGTPDSYRLYTVGSTGEATIDVAKNADHNIEINASYVIVRGLTLKGANKSAISIEPTSEEYTQKKVIIEDNDISDWGSNGICGSGPCPFGINQQAGVYVVGSANTENIQQIIIQRNQIHHPSTDSNSWDEINPETNDDHPNGPHGVTLYQTQGNHVIRYNHFYSDNDHRFNDIVGGKHNFSYGGFAKADMDIYGNIFSYNWDDAVESEGAGKNIRIWGNYFSHTYTDVATATVSVGPTYIWRNITTITDCSDNSHNGVFVKAGGDDGGTGDHGIYWGGRIYVFHNSILQPQDTNGEYIGNHSGITDHGTGMDNLIARNNILHMYKSSAAAIKDRGLDTSNSFDFDLYHGQITAYEGSEPNGINDRPYYALNYGQGNWELDQEGTGNFQLDSSSAGYDAGIPLANFNDNANGLPDIGAHESGQSRMRFGPDAATSLDIIKNGKFSKGTIDWNEYNATLTPDTLDFHSKPQSMLISDRTARYYGLDQTIIDRVTNGSTYVGSAWLKIESPSDRVKMSLDYTDDTGRHWNNIVNQSNPTIGEWFQISGSVDMSWIGTLQKARVYFEVYDSNGNGNYSDYRIDDVFMERQFPGNQPPQFTANPVSLAEAIESENYTQSIVSAVIDPEGDPLAFQKLSGPEWLALSIDGDVSGTPENADVGINQFLVQVIDGNGGSDEAVIEISVADVNHPPVFMANPIDKNQVNIGSVFNSSLIEDAEDADGDQLTFSKLSGPAWLTVEASGVLTGLPTTDDLGLNTFTINVSDGHGADAQSTLLIEVRHTGAVIINGGFENSTVSWSANSATITQSAADAHSGGYSLSVTGRNKRYHGTEQFVTDYLQADTLYSGSAWLKISGDSDRVKMTIDYTDDSGRHWIKIANLSNPPSNEWFKLSGSATFTPTGTLQRARVYFEVYDHDNNSIYPDYLLDDVRLDAQ
ncbi:carbohydrate binding domain-containing protein [Motiliproteus sp. MSK22-1]|uniref:carbohydrate binding domain-containing protein n=1 Tax=Motiliproteus sp. MSK22-1 TaxID=1897630 RepID=UPI000975668D|nr:carbohydrate binding domain-containing protein [Motiliproteus sp. MSK22-1]OMH36159.1 hypothetical protein BGP75_10435 [Motiliproteus sp. MSK22-1]